jgi:integrase
MEVNLPNIENIERARRTKHLPVVLTCDEAERLLANIEGVEHLVVSLLYGTGMRLLEGLRLRVKDIDFGGNAIIIRDGKGAEDRIVMLSEQLVEPLKQQLEYARSLHNLDLCEGLGEVELPSALARKYPQAARSWKWQYVFPSPTRSVHPETGRRGRHHLSEVGFKELSKKR